MYIIDHSTGGRSYGGHRVDRGRVGEENREPAACPRVPHKDQQELYFCIDRRALIISTTNPSRIFLKITY